jgi:hypothetical protein
MPLPIIPPVDYIVHPLTERSVRVYFQDIISPSAAAIISYYNLVSITPGFLPSIVSITPYSTDGRQYQISFDNPISYSATYSLVIDGLVSVNGFSVTTAGHNFTATISGGPVILGAFLSIRECIDVVFDRDVGPYSIGATGTLSNGVLAVPMVQVPWSSAIPSKNLRFTIPIAAPAGDDWFITARTPRDIAGNGRISTVKVSIPSSIPRPLTYAGAGTTLQILDAHVTNCLKYYQANNIRVYFNFALNFSAINPVNYSIEQVFTHPSEDNFNFITAPDPLPGDLPALIILCNDIKSKINAHYTAPQVHLINDPNVITSPNATDQPTCGSILIQAVSSYKLHILSETFHNSKDGVNVINLSGNPDPLNLNNLIVFSIVLKSLFNTHILPSFPVPPSFSTIMGPLTGDYAINSNNPIDSDHTWSVDIRANSLSPKTSYILQCTVTSSDGISTTNPATTGQVLVSPCSSTLVPLSINNEGVQTVKYLLNKNVSSVDSEIAIVSGFDQYSATVNPGISPAAALWMLTELWIEYDAHRLYQPHYLTDNANFINIFNIPNILSFINSANEFLNTFGAHRSGAEYHGLPDINDYPALPATTYAEALILVYALRRAFVKHTLEASLHVGSREKWVSAPEHDMIVLQTPIQRISQEYTTETSVVSDFTYLDDPNTFDFYDTLNLSFIGRGADPEVAAVIPIDAVSYYRENPSFTSDVLEVYLDKQMSQGDLSLVTVTPAVPGPTPVIKKRIWNSSTSFTLNVSGTNPIFYILNASSLEDEAGNPVL